MSATFHAGSIMAVTSTKEGYQITQVDDSSTHADNVTQDVGPTKIVPVDYYRFPVSVKGTYQTISKQLIVDVEVFGDKMGPTIPWNFNLGPLKIPIDLKIASGLITIYLKTDHECWIKYKIIAKRGGLEWEVEELMFEY